jgi:acyl carrier protein
MITEDRVRSIIFDSLQKLLRDDSRVESPPVGAATRLIGAGGVLDSIAFIDLVTEVEEQVEQEIGREFVLRLQELHDLNENKDFLTVGDMARLLTQIISRNEP